MFRLSLFTLALVAAAPSLAQATEKNIARADLVKNSEEAFARVDANKDGQMSRAEIEGFQRAAAVKLITARTTAMFAALDTDKSGQLSAAEFAKVNEGTPNIDVSNIMRADTNKDGKISLAEHRAATLDTFTKADSNKDGILTAAEAQAMMTARN